MTSASPAVKRPPPDAPTVFHLGFAGERQLWPDDATPEQIRVWDELLAKSLVVQLKELKSRLKLPEQHFYVGISQASAGADLAFAAACEKLDVSLRLFLPQDRDEYLHDGSGRGPGFSLVEREQIKTWLDHSLVIQQRIIGQCGEFAARQTETLVEIQRIADAVVVLHLEGKAMPPAAAELVRMARTHNKPVLRLELRFDAGNPVAVAAEFDLPEKYKLPALPGVLAGEKFGAADFIGQIKTHCSTAADTLRERFEFDARCVIWSHVLATAVAAAALGIGYGKASGYGLSSFLYPVIATLLVIELLLLAFGLYKHHKLHEHAVTEKWAAYRLIAEIARSAQAFGRQTDKVPAAQPTQRPDIEEFAGQHTYLRHLFDLSLPPDYRHLVRTINVVHLKATRTQRGADWRPICERYVRERFDTKLTKNRGQIPYYRDKHGEAKKAVDDAHHLFLLCAGLAVLATLFKLGTRLLHLELSDLGTLLSWAAIALPVAAVGVMSITSNLDKEARASSYAEMLIFLDDQRGLLQKAGSEAEFLRLQAETEARLLGETVNWHYRRRFINPA